MLEKGLLKVFNFIKENMLSLIALIIAFSGGLPGLITVINHFKTSKLLISFDKENSLACFMKSQNKDLDGKMAVLLYRLIITGKGRIPSYLDNVDIFIKKGFKWIKGENFYLTEYNVTDKNGDTAKCLILRKETVNDTINLFMASWKKYISGKEKIEFGQPLKISVSSSFDISFDDYNKCKKLK